MLKKDAVSARLNSEAGISYTEFSYQILQGMDYLELHRQYGCVLQTGGSDQWGNLTSGTDLVRKVEGVSVHAIGTPLITNSDGTKFGKSEGNAIWLDAEMCSPWVMYQFWLNTDDRDVIERLKVFTFLSRAEIDEYARLVEDEPFRRAAQKRLAREVVTTVHGADTTDSVIAATEALFGQGDLTGLDATVLRTALQELPHATVAAGSSVVEALTATGLSSSLSDARRAIAQGGVSLDGAKVASDDAVVEGTLPGGCRCCGAARRPSRDSSSADMPFTPSHAVVALPFVRTRLVPAAIAIGAMTPDLPLFVRGMWPDYGLTHDFAWLPVTVVVAFVLLLVWRCALRPATRELLPRPVAERLPAQWDTDARAGVRESVGGGALGILWLVLSLALGVASHIAWDLFTHEGRTGEELLPALAERWGPFSVTKWLQYGSGCSGWPCWGSSRWCGCHGMRPSPYGGCFRMPPAGRGGSRSRFCWSWHPSWRWGPTAGSARSTPPPTSSTVC